MAMERNVHIPSAPVITIDGPSGSGKGTISRLVAAQLGWHFLDSGALYRLVALAARHHTVSLDDEVSLKTLAAHLDVQFLAGEGGREGRIVLEGEEVTDAIRSEECGNAASVVAALPTVRRALLERQRAFREPPGLVADGRDMGTVVFPDAELKIFMTASREERAQRRYKQLNAKGVGVTLQHILDELAERDARDSGRSVSPLRPAADAITIDTTTTDIDDVVEEVMMAWRKTAVETS
ncbi:MAG: (d)CMP kinase [Gammaproteobacteria bacterium]|jgi:cytidylate kinase